MVANIVTKSIIIKDFLLPNYMSFPEKSAPKTAPKGRRAIIIDAFWGSSSSVQLKYLVILVAIKL